MPPLQERRIRVREHNPFTLVSPEKNGQKTLGAAERLRIIHTQTEPALRNSEIFQNAVEQLKKAKFVGQLMQDAESFAIQAVFGATFSMPGEIQDEVSNILQAVTKPGELTPDYNKVKNAVIDHNFKDVDDHSPEYVALLQANALKEYVSRALIREVAADPNQTIFSPVQKETLLYGTRIADVVDEAHIGWWQETHMGNAFKLIRAIQDTKTISDQGIMQMAGLPKLNERDDPNTYDYLYVMFRQDENGALTTVPYSDESAFGSHITRINALVNQMEEAISQNPNIDSEDPDAKGFLLTQRAWIDQLQATDPKEQKKLADERDILWMQQAPAHVADHTTMQLIYGMEAYSAPLPLVQWEYNIAIPDDRYEALNKRAREAQQAMVNYFETDQSDFPQDQYPALKRSVDLMRSSSAVIYSLVKSGSPLGFLFAATNIPNTAAIRLANGSKIFENRKTFSERAHIAQGLMNKLFAQSPEDLARYNDIDAAIDMLAGVFVPLHEVGHNLAVGPTTRELLTPSVETNIEEAKADLAGLVGSLALLTEPQDRELLIASVLMEELRGLTRRKEQEDRSHLHGNILDIQLMLDADVVRKKPDGTWEFNFTHGENGTVDAFFAGAIKALQEMALVYEHPSREAGERFIRDHFTESEALLTLEFAAGIIETQEELDREITKSMNLLPQYTL